MLPMQGVAASIPGAGTKSQLRLTGKKKQKQKTTLTRRIKDLFAVGELEQEVSFFSSN